MPTWLFLHECRRSVKINYKPRTKKYYPVITGFGQFSLTRPAKSYYGMAMLAASGHGDRQGDRDLTPKGFYSEAIGRRVWWGRGQSEGKATYWVSAQKVKGLVSSPRAGNRKPCLPQEPPTSHLRLALISERILSLASKTGCKWQEAGISSSKEADEEG